MKQKKTSIIRESVKKVVSLLTNRGITVTQRGMSAYVKYDSTGKIKQMNVPYLPDDASEEFVRAVMGFVAHEVGHVIFTDPESFRASDGMGSVGKQIVNIIEDVYIEREIIKLFPGIEQSIRDLRDFYVNSIVIPEITKALADGNAKKATSFLYPVQFRAWGGQDQLAKLLKENPLYAQMIAPFGEKVSIELRDEIANVRDSFHSVEIAKRIIDSDDREESERDKKGEGEDAPGDPAEFGEGDFDDQVADALSQRARDEGESSTYIVYTTDFDEIRRPRPVSDDEAQKYREALMSKVGPLQKALERAMAAKDKRGHIGGLRKGSVSARALYRSAAGDDRLFRQRYEANARNTAVSIVVDCSGSMTHNGKIKVAMDTALVMSMSLGRMRINHEVLGFTGIHCEETKNGIANEAACLESAGAEMVTYARTESLLTYLIKPFSSSFRMKESAYFFGLGEKRFNQLAQNIDGESIQIAHKRLKAQRAQQHVLIVLSDGQPECVGDYSQLTSHLRTVVDEIAQSGTKIIGIGIKNSSVSAYYPKYVVIESIDEITGTAMKELGDLILR